MKHVKTLILDHQAIEPLVNMKQAIHAVEMAFHEYGHKRVQMPAKIYLDLPQYQGDFRAMPAYIEKYRLCTLKWVNTHPKNSRFGLPAVMAVMILSDPRNGFPLCIMDGTLATDVRTGAAGAVAVKYLARKDSRVIALVGCGAQARTQLQALRQVRTVKKVLVWGHEKVVVDQFIKTMKIRGELMLAAGSIKDCVENSDIIVTTTPSRKPVVKAAWIKKGTHINAIGADAVGKQELQFQILKKAKVIIDDWQQAAHSGEINVPLKRKQIRREDIYADLGTIVAGRKRGRTQGDEITVFDSTGLAIQDVAVAHMIYQKALKKRVGQRLSIV